MSLSLVMLQQASTIANNASSFAGILITFKHFPDMVFSGNLNMKGLRP